MLASTKALAEDVALLTHEAEDVRVGSEPTYRAYVASLYARAEGRWLLRFHPQTPSA